MKSAEIGDVLKSGKTAFSNCFVLKIAPSPKKEKPAVVVSKKIFKTAASRNGAKRKIKAALSNPLFKNRQKNVFLVFNLNEKIVKTTVKELLEEVKIIFSKNGIIS